MKHSSKIQSILRGNAFDNRILRIFVLSFFLLTAYFLISDYFSIRHQATHLTLDKLSGIATSLAKQIDSEEHSRLVAACTQKDAVTSSTENDDYYNIHLALKASAKAHNLNSPIYTFVKCTKSENTLEFIATSSDEPYFRHKYTTLPEKAFASLDKGGRITLFEDEFGHWISAFAPIKDENGEVVAYVQADERFDTFMMSLRSHLLLKGTLSLVGFMIVLFFLMPYLMQLFAKEESGKRLLKQSLAETKSLSKELIKKEGVLQEYANKLEESNRDLTDFAHIASHDLKAPIRNIHSFSQLILKKNKDVFDEKTLQHFEFIVKNSHRAQQLINGLLTYSTADKNIGKPTEFNLLDSVMIANQNLSSIIADKNVTVDISKDLPQISANLSLVAQVLQNLINNGIKYNQSATPKITIETGVSETKGRFYCVADNGIGIPEKHQKDIFKMFIRLHSSKEYEGSGIGLAFCHRVVKTYGGEMWLESIAGQGSVFYFTLPKAELTSALV